MMDACLCTLSVVPVVEPSVVVGAPYNEGSIPVSRTRIGANEPSTQFGTAIHVPRVPNFWILKLDADLVDGEVKVRTSGKLVVQSAAFYFHPAPYNYNLQNASVTDSDLNIA